MVKEKGQKNKQRSTKHSTETQAKLWACGIQRLQMSKA